MTTLPGISARVKRLSSTVDSWKLRDRALLFAAVIFALIALWYLLFYNPQHANNLHLEESIITSKAQLKEIKSKQQGLVAKLTAKTTENAERLKALNVELSSITAQLSRFEGGMTSSDDVVRMLRQVLLEDSGVDLISLKRLPPEPVNTQGVVLGAKNILYSQGIKVTLRGTYFTALDYLQRLEELPWRLFWDSLEYDVDQYPEGKMVLKLHTLSETAGG